MNEFTTPSQEMKYAKERLQRAEFVFNNCDQDMVAYANAELTAAQEFLKYVLVKYRSVSA